MSLETLKNLPLVQTVTQPLSTTAKNFYLNTFALGNGPDGTYLLTDFLGTAIGVTVGTYFSEAATVIDSMQTAGTLSDLNEIYDVIQNTLDGDYPDPANPPDGIEIPAGLPGAGIYADLDAAIVALVALANAEISALNSGANATALNTAWNAICARLVYEAGNQAKGSLSMPALIAGDKLSVMALTTTLGSIGQETQEGMGAQFFEAIADLTTQSGQAIVGSLREGRNNAAMDSAYIGHDNIVPDQPATPPPQATLSNGDYTVAQARAASTP